MNLKYSGVCLFMVATKCVCTAVSLIIHRSANTVFYGFQETYGRVLRIRNLPMPDEYTDADFLSIVEPYGKVVRHWMFRLHQTVSRYIC